ncbi:MAG TPA: glycosidase, partial [Chloroflexota bacterium]|nr:glycosidase [Chloroflexota bacterium]
RCDLTRVIWRSSEPIMMPDSEQEMFGIVNNVVFPTGIDVIDEHAADVYYGMADARIGVARMWLRPEACMEDSTEAA